MSRTPRSCSPSVNYRTIGQRVPRPDALDKVKGSAVYIEDMAVAGALLAGVLRSPHAHARIKRIDVTAARARPGVHAVLTAADIPGKNLIPMIQSDWPVLADGLVRHVGEAVALVAAEDRESLARALAMITVEYDPLAPRLDAEEALAKGEVLAQWKVRRREEDMAVMSKRHPGRIRMRTGATRDGRLVACEVDYLLDGGAYATLSPVVLFRGTVHACGPYRVPNVKVDARAVRTNTVPCGAFRGFGEPQVVFACESQMDLLAERLGMDPLALRRLNALGPGQDTITGHRLAASVGFREVLDKVADASGWERKRAEFGHDHGPVRRGIGLAACYYGVGLGAMGKHLNPAGAGVVVAADGSVTVAVGTTELGQGMITVRRQT